MNKIIIAFVFGVVSAIAIFNPAQASATNSQTPDPVRVYGQVSDRGKWLEGLEVVWWCSDTRRVGSYITDEYGFYEFEASSTVCPRLSDGRLLVYRVEANGKKLIASQYARTFTNIGIYIRMEDSLPVDVPEFGWLGGVAAGGISGGALLGIRRRMQR